jgi:arylformamidase
MTEYIDISILVSPGALIHPGDPAVEFIPSISDRNGLRISVTELHLGSHTGTHLDSPAHFGFGDATVDRVPPDVVIGPADVLDMRGIQRVGAEALLAARPRTPRVLLRTDNSRWIGSGPIADDPAHLTCEGAACLVAQGAVLVGIDGLSVDAPTATDVHEVLLRAGVAIPECIDLSQVEPGSYELLCLPLRMPVDGAPARALLRRKR